MDIFETFPTITYENKTSKNIILKAGLVRDLIKKYKVFYPYSVKDGERPDTIAYDYYGDSSYEWLVCLPNNIIDIHSDWIKSYAEFYRYMLEKYSDVNATKNTIHHYEYTGIPSYSLYEGGLLSYRGVWNDAAKWDSSDTSNYESDYDVSRKNWKMSPRTYSALSIQAQFGWNPVYLYDYEDRLNEEKRQIILLSNQYLKQIDREVRELFV